VDIELVSWRFCCFLLSAESLVFAFARGPVLSLAWGAA